MEISRRDLLKLWWAVPADMLLGSSALGFLVGCASNDRQKMVSDERILVIPTTLPITIVRKPRIASDCEMGEGTDGLFCYTVQRDDIFGRIVEKYGINNLILTHTNELQDEGVRIGDKLLIPDMNVERRGKSEVIYIDSTDKEIVVDKDKYALISESEDYRVFSYDKTVKIYGVDEQIKFLESVLQVDSREQMQIYINESGEVSTSVKYALEECIRIRRGCVPTRIDLNRVFMSQKGNASLVFTHELCNWITLEVGGFTSNLEREKMCIRWGLAAHYKELGYSYEKYVQESANDQIGLQGNSWLYLPIENKLDYDNMPLVEIR